ncbi:unnamed protein product [Calypogeia fissa]
MPGLFLMLLLGIDEWASIYLLAQRSGVKMALHCLKEYIDILYCMEGDDAFELEKARVLERPMDIALTKVASDTEIACAALLVGTTLSTTAKEPSVDTPIETIVLLSSPSDIPSTSASLSLNETLESFSSSPHTPFLTTFLSAPVDSSSSADLHSCIQDNPLCDLTWLTKDEANMMNEVMCLVDCSPIIDGSNATDTSSGEPYVSILPPCHIK